VVTPGRRLALGRLLGAALAWALRTAAAQPAAARSEYQIKAAYLFKFLGFVEWPQQAFDGPHTPLAVGVLGADPLAEELAAIVGSRQVEGRPVLARRLRADESPAHLHALFVGRGSQGRLPALLAMARGQALLTITEAPDTPAEGSAINFIVVDNKVRFDVVLTTAEQMNLKVSARLLAVARKVLPPPS
jgi:hypothetical protein